MKGVASWVQGVVSGLLGVNIGSNVIVFSKGCGYCFLLRGVGVVSAVIVFHVGLISNVGGAGYI